MDNQLVGHLQEANADIPDSEIRFRIYNASRTPTDFAPTQNPVGSGSFVATFSGPAGIYDGIVQILVDGTWLSTGQQFDSFLWDGAEFERFANLQPVLDAIGALPDPQAGAESAIAAANLATTANVTAARDAILTQGNTAWVTPTGFSTLTGPDITAALAAYPVARPQDVDVTVNGGFTGPDRTILTGLATTIGPAGSGLTEAGGTGDQFTGIPAPTIPVLANITQVAGSPVSGVADFRADVVGALTAYTVPTLAQVQAAGFTVNRNNALEDIDLRVQELYQRQGLDQGVTATVVDPTVTTPGSLVVREGATVLISQTLTKPDEDTVTISRNA